MTPAILGNYEENGRQYGGFRKGKYMFPTDEVIYGLAASRRAGLTWSFFTARDGSHGYLSQVLFCCETRSSAFDALHTELRPRATDIRSRNRHRNLGD
jgi:hypothetical protein